MDSQNVTLAIPREVLRKAKLIAAKRNTSLSSLMTHALLDLVNAEEGYDHARQRHVALLESGLDLGTYGKVTWSREALHER